MRRLFFSCLLALGSAVGFAGELKVMSFNVCHGQGMDGKVDLARTAARILAENPDFACLQEIDRRTARVGGMDEPAELARLTGLRPTFAKAIPFDGGEYGVMILSREEPLRVEKTPLPGTEPRVLLVCEFKNIVVATSHLSVATPEERAASVPLVRAALGKYDKPVVFTGDWNAHADSDVLAALRKFLVVKSDERCKTFHGHPLNGPDGRVLSDEESCIDYIACDVSHAPAFEVLEAHVVEDRVTSDHAPVVVRFRTPDGPVVARVVATANRSDCRYASGEQAAVSFAFVDTNGVPLKAGRVKLTVDNWGTRELLPARTVDLAAENPIRVATSRATPGFVRMILASADPKALHIEGNWCWGRHLDDFTYGLGYDVDKIVSGTPDVPDFDAFWSNAVARLDATVPVDARVEPRPSADAEFVVSRISVATAQGRRVWGWLTEPADRSKGPYPLHVDVSGAGIGETEPHKGLPGRIACLMNVHTYPQPEGTGKAVEDERLRLYREQNKRLAEPCGVKEYYHAGIHRSREDYFYYAVVLGLNRTVNWLASRPECDAAHITYGGTSQGGGMGLALAYLNPHISRATIAVPAVTDLLGSRAEEGRLSGWPGLVEAQKPENRAAAAANAPYFCGVNFARRIRKPIRFAVGFADRTCPPMAGYAAFNACPSADKDILGGVAMSHQPFDEFYKQLDDWECHSRPHDGKMIFHGED